MTVGEERLAGVPDDVCLAARAAAEADGQPGYKLSLQAPCWLPLMQFASDRALRETIYRADATRASEFGPTELDNGPLMRELLELRAEAAALLGYANYAELALVAKMARSPDEVLAFVRDLACRARPHADRELAELRDFAAQALGLPDLQAWDRPYAAEQLKQSRYAFSSQEVKQYFTEPRVLQGLFQLIETLFGVAIREEAAPVWHDSVRYYGVWRPTAAAGDTGPERVAGFYLDLHARAGKQSGAWMDDCRGRWRRPGGELQLPVAHLVCNFAPPVGDQPALLTHSDLITLFHEFGHGLHHMLTQVDELAVSGISGVEGDAIELPSQFMENFCWEWDVLQRLSCHADTGEPLPRTLFDRMVAARHFQGGLKLLRQCEFALFDMRLHAESDTAARVRAVCDEVNAELQPMPAPAFLRYANTFGHLFDGGYAAGYYGYAWAQVLSADAFGAFEENGVFDAATGARFRDQVLAVGGSRPALESFRAFRGRDPSLDALLRHQGLA
jgi:oligopeptidase A